MPKHAHRPPKVVEEAKKPPKKKVVPKTEDVKPEKVEEETQDDVEDSDS